MHSLPDALPIPPRARRGVHDVHSNQPRARFVPEHPDRRLPATRYRPSSRSSNVFVGLVSCTTLVVNPRSSQNSIARSEEHTSELQSLMRISYAVLCLQKKNNPHISQNNP